MNGYDQHSLHVQEAAASRRSDGKSSQRRDGSNRFDTSTPEKKRKALAAARRSDNPEDLKRVQNEAASMTAARDNRFRRRGGGYRSPMTEQEARECGIGDFAAGYIIGQGGGHGDWDHEGPDGPPMAEANSTIDMLMLQQRRRGRQAESALNPQIPPRDTLERYSEKELTTKARNKLSSSQFALPPDRYPIPDEAHARNALARVAQNGSPEEISKVRAAVRRKFPGIDVSGGKQEK